MTGKFNVETTTVGVRLIGEYLSAQRPMPARLPCNNSYRCFRLTQGIIIDTTLFAVQQMPYLVEYDNSLIVDQELECCTYRKRFR